MDIITKLTRLGLSESEAKVYLHLVKNNACSASEIAKSTGISRTQTYQIINNLIKSNMCIEQRGSIKKYSAIDPAKVATAIQKDLETKNYILKNVKDELSAMYKADNQNENPFDFIKVLYTKTSIIKTIETLETEAQKSVLAFNKPPYVMNLDIMDENFISQEVRETEKNSIDKGVVFKSLYEIENTDSFLKKIEYFQRMGEEVRVLSNLPFKLFVFDEKVITIALQNKMQTGLQYVTLLIEHQDFAVSMKEIFYLYWLQGMTIEEFKKIKKEGE